jgi:hypothetical protein
VVELVATQMDCGWLDHERFKIKHVWNQNSGVVLENPPSTRGVSLIAGGSTNAQARTAVDAPNWLVQDPMNQPGEKAEFDVTYETNSSGDVGCRINVKSNPAKHNIGVRVPLNVPADLVGKTAVLQVTLDPGISVWSKDYTKGYAIRLAGERTMCATPPLQADDEVNFVVTAPEGGRTVRISGLSVMK